VSCRLWLRPSKKSDFLGILLGCWDVGTQAMQRQSHRDSHTVPGKEISLDTLRFFLTTTGAALEGVRG